jgi:hypothetical protein
MMADLAAGYCGEKHVEDFLERVGTAYPTARVEDTARRKFWYKEDLDKALGLHEPVSTLGQRFRGKISEKRHG